MLVGAGGGWWEGGAGGGVGGMRGWGGWTVGGVGLVVWRVERGAGGGEGRRFNSITEHV